MSCIQYAARASVLLLAVFAATACGPQIEPDVASPGVTSRGQGRRGTRPFGTDAVGKDSLGKDSLGKADSSRSCKNECGKQAPGGCYCDKDCDKYGDCCGDRLTYCKSTTFSCVGRCGGKAPGGCYCDSTCARYGDCCDDMVAECETPKPPATCTGDSDCKSGEYCASSDGCLGGGSGVCTKKPTSCPGTKSSVCGCDLRSYTNACYAAKAGANILLDDRSCGMTGRHCGGMLGVPCPIGYKCLGKTGASGVCMPTSYCQTAAHCEGLVAPSGCNGTWSCQSKKCEFKCNDKPKCYVGGCHQQVCSDKSGVVTSCAWKSWYGCLKHTSCGNNGPGGSCAWKSTSTFNTCVTETGDA